MAKRAVFDTNVLVSAYLWTGPARRALIFLSLAIDGQADAIVSGDHHLLDIRKFKGIPIITVRKFLAQ